MQPFRVVLLLGAFAVAHGLNVRPRQVNGCNCAGNVYDTQYLDDSIAAAQAGGAGEYPHQYEDFEGFTFSNCSAPFYEYPIIAGDQPYDGTSPGADRVIYDDFGDFCACLTHTGASGNNFLECSF